MTYRPTWTDTQHPRTIAFVKVGKSYYAPIRDMEAYAHVLVFKRENPKSEPKDWWKKWW